MLAIITWQDIKERLVYWFCYPLVGILGFFNQKPFLEVDTIIVNSLVNLSLTATVILILWVYCKIILKKKLINQSIGMGDVLFFLALTFCFSIVSFYVLFVFSLFFSLLMHFLLKKSYKEHTTIPLAGYMAVFFAFVYTATFFMNCNLLFAY
ncbi:general secretion pathway protein [Flavobacterium sp.]|uniref:general secretion pathway protein n=1 Tax=Flavobacterium sp. TaxID=239 RepID=UPI00261C0C08|nr:general secretion pathway protein [Flavobacterium sp.]